MAVTKSDLKNGVALEATYRGEQVRAIVLIDGDKRPVIVVTKGKIPGGAYRSTTSAASVATGRPTSGNQFWDVSESKPNKTELATANKAMADGVHRIDRSILIPQTPRVPKDEKPATKPAAKQTAPKTTTKATTPARPSRDAKPSAKAPVTGNPKRRTAAFAR